MGGRPWSPRCTQNNSYLQAQQLQELGTASYPMTLCTSAKCLLICIPPSHNPQGPIFTQPVLALGFQCTDNLKHWGIWSRCTLESLYICPPYSRTRRAIGLLLAGSALAPWGFAYRGTTLWILTAALDEPVFPIVSHFSDLYQVIPVLGQCNYRQQTDLTFNFWLNKMEYVLSLTERVAPTSTPLARWKKTSQN